MTSKFKVGDKVEVVGNEHGGWAVGTVGKITGITKRFPPISVEKDGDVWYHTEDELELFSPKPSKNQRITALEETVAKQGEEISELKLIVAQIRKPSTVVEEALTAASSVEDKPQSEGERLIKQREQHFSPVEKSPNEKRAEMIEKAKMFIEGNKNSDGYYNVYDNNNGISFPQIPFRCKVEFIVIEKKRTVIALMRGFQSNRVLSKGITKCMPGDVFNKYIGMAIALGRALGLDVSEFEQAVQPNEVVIGHVATHEGSELDYTITKIDGGMYYTEPGSHYHKGSFVYGSARIINDTNAIYGGGE